MENLDFMSQVLRAQKKALMAWLAVLGALVILAGAMAVILRRLNRIRKEQAEAAAVIDETFEDLRSAPLGKSPALTERERQVLTFIAGGKTNVQIAETLFLSPETIKWYRKKLLAKFDVPSSAALVSKAKDLGLV